MSSAERICRNIRVTGVVQGVGFRPFVFKLAERYEIAGWVRNTSGNVEIAAEGARDALESFMVGLRKEAPPLSGVETVTWIPADPKGYSSFAILDSSTTSGAMAVIPPDVATCPDCIREVDDSADRRYLYPFTNCTNCGPRFTITRRIPYDRANTTMSAFAMCPECEAEYSDPTNRRFHAEPIACQVCGPRVWLEVGEETILENAIEEAGRLLAEGRVVAVKGLGGFHLACDARNQMVVQTLRERKGRAAKPFALMVRDLDEAEKLCVLGNHARTVLLSPQRPIVVSPKNAGCEAAESIAPGNKHLGVMLPYTPIHHLLLRHSPPALVMTSGNLAEEPLAFANSVAREKLAGLCDAYLMHDRDIHVPCDDSVVRPLDDGSVIMVRRARGFVPDAIEMPVECDCILGVGAEQKSTFCIAWDRKAVLSQHIGDLDAAETLDYYEYAVDHFLSLFAKSPEIIAHDLHPDYLSTAYARARPGARLVGVQHHHAHIAACLAENGRMDRCIGVALDGTGHGPDGTVWGGEVLVADFAGYERIAHIAQLRLPGGDAAVCDPRRMAMSYLHAAYPDRAEKVASELGLDFTSLEARVLARQIETGLNSPLTSSAGRLFDAVSAAIGVCRERSYEGQPAVELEMIADEGETESYKAAVAGGILRSLPISTGNGMLVMDAVSVFREAVDDWLGGASPGVVSARFHNSLADLITRTCECVREKTSLELVALSGGVFQNARILCGLKRRLTEQGFEVLVHNLLPPNDACISLGQAAVAAARKGF